MIKDNVFLKGLVLYVLVSLCVFGVSVLFVALLGGRAEQLEPEPVEHIELPDNLTVTEFDIADTMGEMGKLYVLRAEWVYLSRESAEEKMGELYEY
jgi:hypothetical protein